MTASETLTNKQLMSVFGVSHMTIYNWGKGTASVKPLPSKRTPAAITKWAERNGVDVAKKPEAVLRKEPALRRLASGRLTGVRKDTPSRSR